MCRAVLQTLVVVCQRDLQCSSFCWLCENVLCSDILKREVDELDAGALVQLPEWRMCTKKLQVQNLAVASGESLADEHGYWYLMFCSACLVMRRHVWRAFYSSTVPAVAHCFLILFCRLWHFHLCPSNLMWCLSLPKVFMVCFFPLCSSCQPHRRSLQLLQKNI